MRRYREFLPLHRNLELTSSLCIPPYSQLHWFNKCSTPAPPPLPTQKQKKKKQITKENKTKTNQPTKQQKKKKQPNLPSCQRFIKKGREPLLLHALSIESDLFLIFLFFCNLLWDSVKAILKAFRVIECFLSPISEHRSVCFDRDM